MLGFVFPGQGSQQQGMLSELAAAFPLVEETFDEASAVLGLPLWDIVQHNRDNGLHQTAITQPILVAASVAIARIWRQQGGEDPAILSGHSVGEYSALVWADSLGFADALTVVHQRGQFMQAAVPQGVGKMAAIVGLDSARIGQICQQARASGKVSAANFNAPGQTVIAGEALAVDQAMALCRQAGARRALPLQVSVPSHCELMEPAAERLAEVLAVLPIRPPRIPVVQNVHGKASEDPEAIRTNLRQQLYSPVLWVECVQTMAQAGVTHLLECGPGRVLSGLVKRIDPELACFASDNPTALQQARTAMSGGRAG